MWLGPSAVLAFAREGYKLTDVNVKDLIDALGYRYASEKQTLVSRVSEVPFRWKKKGRVTERRMVCVCVCV